MLEMRPKKGQLKFFRPTNLKQGQISETCPKKGQPGNPTNQQNHNCVLDLVDATEG